MLEEIVDESDQEEAGDTGEKSDTDEDYHEGDSESDGGNDYEDNDKDHADVSVNEVLQNSDILPSPSNVQQLINWPLRKIMKQRCYPGFVTTEIAIMILVDIFRNLTNIITFIFPPLESSYYPVVTLPSPAAYLSLRWS